MLTFFTIPKPFSGPIDVIQRNAIKSWTLLEPSCEVILMGDEEGTDKAAADLGVRNVRNVSRNELGTPLLDSAFQLAESEASYPNLCYVNADIILMSDFIAAVERVKAQSQWFLMTARRWNLDIREYLDFGNGWQNNLLREVSNKGTLGQHTQIDFWVYSKTLLNGMPQLAVGRPSWECWCLYKTRAMKADLVDCTNMVVSVHQSHDYSHHPEGEAIGRSIEAERNRELVGGKPYFFVIRDRTHVLTKEGLKRVRDGWSLWRGLRTAQVLPLSAPLPVRLMVKAINTSINMVRDFLVLARQSVR